MKIHNFVLFVSLLAVSSTVRSDNSEILANVSPQTVLAGGLLATAVVLDQLAQSECFSNPQAAVAYLAWNGFAYAYSSGSAQDVLTAYAAPLGPVVAFFAKSFMQADMCPNSPCWLLPVNCPASK